MLDNWFLWIFFSSTPFFHYKGKHTYFSGTSALC
jgi:hypothetical protein